MGKVECSNKLITVSGKGTTDRDEVATPAYVYDDLDKMYNFNHDPCPLGGLRDGKDGLKGPWGTRAFVNPPYSATRKWVAKGLRQAKKGKLVVMLIPARTNTAYWHKLVFRYATRIHFLSRVTFFPFGNACPFPLAVVVFDGINGIKERESVLVRSEQTIKKRTRPKYSRFSLS
jgi:hypothetical protein